MKNQPFILIKGEPKGLQIEKINTNGNGVYFIKFNRSEKIYTYSSKDVIILDKYEWHDHTQCKVYIQGKEQHNLLDIKSYTIGNKTHWRITYNNNYIQDYIDDSIDVHESCLSDDVAKNSFEYLKRIAKLNGLGKSEDSKGILSNQYENIYFIDKKLSIAPYLYPEKYNIKKSKAADLIFPFGCNASQREAVMRAFESQVSIIQGPPGTGKTQTILNIIANILLQGKTVIVVSNNNLATANVLEKLQKYNMGFVVAPLGKLENKTDFINNQPVIPEVIKEWKCNLSEKIKLHKNISDTLHELKSIFLLQENLAQLKLEQQSLDTEWQHFKSENNVDENTYNVNFDVKSSRLLYLWLKFQAYSEDDYIRPQGFINRIKEKIHWWWINCFRKYMLNIKSEFNTNKLDSIILELQSLYYQVKQTELKNKISEIETELKSIDAIKISKNLTDDSMTVLKGVLYNKYYNLDRDIIPNVKALKENPENVCKGYPIILSTTFSARTSLGDKYIYDYIIMDEASQVSVETGALALTCAKNAVIVGDTLQLPNVVTDDDKEKLSKLFINYKIKDGYDCSKNSFLKSVCTLLPDAPQTLLREHYRCHPKIINFCNQKFYGGNLLIMTTDEEEPDTMQVIKTVPGQHSRDHYNQREIDVIKQEVLPNIVNISDIGIISPYNLQVDEINRQLSNVEAATVHKYQGREKDTIIFSVVDDQITEFSDDANLLNVAISRAKKQFCLVLSGNKQKLKGNISELVDYIEYNNYSVTNSKICSIFDYLYSQYTEQRMAIISNNPKISEYDSENLTYALIKEILQGYQEFSHLGVLCHIPLRNILSDRSLLNEIECKYVLNYNTHVDFLIFNHVSKKPVLAIETDGYSYHNKETEQYKRDEMKNHILSCYNIPLLRLSTTGSGEKETIIKALHNTR